jgi:hypothetical protein
MVNSIDMKPFLRISSYQHAVSDDLLAEFPMRLARNGDGFYYWTMARDGEFHWWLLVEPLECTDEAKK